MYFEYYVNEFRTHIDSIPKMNKYIRIGNTLVKREKIVHVVARKSYLPITIKYPYVVNVRYSDSGRDRVIRFKCEKEYIHTLLKSVEECPNAIIINKIEE